MTTDLGSLLERASAAPFGPLSLTCRLAGAGWSLTVQLNPREPVIVEALRYGASGALYLERRFAAGAESDLRELINSAPWVMSLDTAGIGVALRLWLHSDGLEMNTLLSALAYFARLDDAELGGQARQVAAEPVTAVQPEAKPVVPVRPLAWQSFETEGLESTPAAATEPIASEEPPQLEGDIPVTDSPAGQAPPAALAEIEQPGQESDVEPSGVIGASLAQPPPEVAATPAVIPQPAGVGGNCRECGSPFSPDHAFCTTCGARLT